MKEGKKVISLGQEFFVIPSGFGELMVQTMMKSYKITRKQARTKIYNYLEVGRKTKRKALKVRLL